MGPRIRRGYPSDLRPRHTRTTTGTTSASIDSVSSVKSGRVKTGTPHIVPLARQSVEILRELHPLTGHGRYVFPNARYPHRERPMSEATLWGALRALDVRPDRMTMHGFRAMGRTILDEVLGFRPDFIEHQLAHAVRDPNGRAYNRTAFLPERRKMMQSWADYLDQ